MAKAETLQCMTNLKSIGAAVFLYAEDNADRVPSNGELKNGTELKSWSWDDRLAGYDGRTPFSDEQKNHGGNGWWLETSPIYICPADDQERVARRATRSYAPNWIRNNNSDSYNDFARNLVGRGIVTVPNSNNLQQPYSMSLSAIRFPNLSIGWCDFITDHNGLGLIGNGTGAVDALHFLGWPYFQKYRNALHGEFQHNYWMLDGHVETLWFPDTLEVLHSGRNGEQTRSPTADPFTVNSSYTNSVIGTFWDCW